MSAPDNDADCLQDPGLSYGNEGYIRPAGIVSESSPLGVVLHDEGSKARKEPEANIVSNRSHQVGEETYQGNSVS